jgi:hypothetical protein
MWSSNGALRSVEPAVSQGQHTVTQRNAAWDYLAKEDGRKRKILRRFPFGTVCVILPVGDKRMKGTDVFRSVPVWGPVPVPNLRK